MKEGSTILVPDTHFFVFMIGMLLLGIQSSALNAWLEWARGGQWAVIIMWMVVVAALVVTCVSMIWLKFREYRRRKTSLAAEESSLAAEAYPDFRRCNPIWQALMVAGAVFLIPIVGFLAVRYIVEISKAVLTLPKVTFPMMSYIWAFLLIELFFYLIRFLRWYRRTYP
jgi:hypothetical protein